MAGADAIFAPEQNAVLRNPIPLSRMSASAGASPPGPGRYANPCVEFYFEVVPGGTPPQRVRDLLAAAWAHDPLTALKLVGSLRLTAGTSSGKEGFYTAMLWMHEHHPKTLAYNLPAFADSGCLKDVPELLFRVIHGADARRKLANKGRRRGSGSRVPVPLPVPRSLGQFLGRKRVHYHLSAETPMIGQVAGTNGNAQEEEQGHKMRKRARLAGEALLRYNSDREYHSLLDQTALFFADLLRSDVHHMGLGEYDKIGLAAKWCPTPRSFIHTTLLCQAIARCLFPRDSDPSYAELPEEHYTFRVLNRLHHKVLTPLRRILRLPQVYMTSSRRWTDLPYANVAMQRYKAHADTMATRRFTRFEARGKVVKLTGTAALPKTERQWCRLVDSLRDKNLLSNCMVFCDMSKSMDGTPMEVSAALGLLISQLGEYPWEGRVITLNNDDDDEEPQITKIRGKTLLGKLSFLHKMQCDDDLSIDFRALFNYMYEYILDKAKKLKLEQDNMIRSVFVFTDKELDEAWVSPWTQDYRAFCRRFKEAGYGAMVPQIVFWNLGDSHSAAVTSRLPGVMILKGFSNNLLKSFLENNGVVYPEDEMSSALDRDEFKNLSLFD